MQVRLNFILIIMAFTVVRAANRLQAEKEVLDMLLAPDKYHVEIRPEGSNKTAGPVVVKTDVYVRSISDVDDIKMEYNVQLSFRQTWVDPRLTYDDKDGLLKYVTVLDRSRMWIPDTFFSNEQSGQFYNIITPNIMIRIFPNGEVLFSTRVSLTLSCEMDLKKYPMDRQECSIIMASYGYTTEDMVFQWKSGNPVQISKRIMLPQFKLTKFSTDYCTSKTTTGEYACLKVMLNLSRELNSYLVGVYIPFFMQVILSWLPFWLDYRSTMPRIGIWLTLLLTMTITAIKIQFTAPAIAYTKAIDVWSGICMTFLFCVVIELVLVMQCVHNEDQVRKGELAEQDNLLEKSLMAIDDHGEKKERSSESKFGRLERWLGRYKSRGQKIDVIARICFPLVFALFNLFYWSTYLSKD